MASSIKLGWIAPGMTVELDIDSDWFTELIKDDGDYPDGTEIYIRYIIPNEAPVRWDAVISGNVATMYKTFTEVAELVEMEPESAKLFHLLDGVKIGWYKGDISDNT